MQNHTGVDQSTGFSGHACPYLQRASEKATADGGHWYLCRHGASIKSC